jgi:hypothetical protein
MIKHLKISNFKSIRELELDCKRVNVFIGEPNKGKTNILEGLSLISDYIPEELHDYIRFANSADLFFDFNTSKIISIDSDKFYADITFIAKGGIFEFFIRDKKNPAVNRSFEFDILGKFKRATLGGYFSDVFPYYFRNIDAFKSIQVERLSPPFGDNIPTLLFANPNLKKVVSDFVRENGYRLTLRPTENEIFLTKEVGDELYSYPYLMVSETVRRIIFLMLAIESNKDSILLLDEPEAHTFPFYTHYIAERIALDASNQYFLTTHNSYLLHSIVEKTPTEELNVGIVYMENYETKVHILTPEQLSQLSETDIFYNLDLFLEA